MFEVNSPVLRQRLRRRKNAKTDPALFQDAFKDSPRITRSSGHSVLNDQNSGDARHDDSSLRAENNRRLEDVAKSPEGHPRFELRRKSLKDADTSVFEAVFTSPKVKNSDLLSTQPKKVTDLSAEDVESSSPIFSQPFKRKKHAKTDPALFQDVFQDSTRNTRPSGVLTAPKSGDTGHDSSLTTENSRSLEVVAKSPETHPRFERQHKNVKDAHTSVFETFKRKRRAKTDPALFQDVFQDSTRNKRSTRVLNAPNSETSVHNDSSLMIQHSRTLGEAARSPESRTPFQRQRKKVAPQAVGSEVFESTTPHSTQMEENKMHKSVKHKQSTSNKSVKPQNMPWIRQWQLKAAATRNLNNFALLPREERSTKLEAIVKKKHDEALKSRLMLETVSREPEVPRTLKVTPAIAKKPVPRKPLHPDLLVNGKPYRPRRLKRPKPWATTRLYKFIIQKCEEKYGMLRARRKAEEFVVFLCDKVSTVIRRKNYENYKSILEEIKRALYKLGVIKCLMDYFVFIEDYLPHLYRIKAIPCVGAYGKHTGPPWVPGTNLVADLGY